MARSLWKGAISFGLLHIPVQLFSAVKEQKRLDLSMLDRRDFAPVGLKRYNKLSGAEVAADDIVKGYEYAEGEFVVLTDEDLQHANLKAPQTIAIFSFVSASDVPMTYFEQPYFLAPERGGDKVYALLRETLRQAGKIAIASLVLRTKQHACALLCFDDVIVLNTLRYHDEMRTSEELHLPENSAVGISDKEVQMALSLVEGMSETWHPEQYRDSYRDDILKLVDEKVRAKQSKIMTLAEPAQPAQPAQLTHPEASGNVVDLVALLKQSLGKAPAASDAAGKDKSTDAAAKKSASHGSTKSRKSDFKNSKDDAGADSKPARA